MSDISTQLNEVFQSGPVTALEIIGDTVLAGIGCYLHIYDLITTQRIQYTKALPHQNIHGIEKDHTTTTTTTTTTTDSLLCIYGEKLLNIVSYSDKRITEEHQSREFQDWIWDVRWLTHTDQCPDMCVAIALGHNVIVHWNWTTDQLLNYVHCQEQCILYSAHFIGVSWDQLLLASGTVFNQVVVWSPVANTTVEPSGQTTSKPLQYFTGHQGVIFSIHYHKHRQLMCSVSDDRSIRVWKLSFQGKTAPESILPEDWAVATSEIVHVLYGHSARVWRARLLMTGIISIGEDATCCIWDAEGQIIQNFKGHKGKSIWSLALNEEETVAVTGGGDCSIRVWKIGNVEEGSRTFSKTHLRLDNSILPDTANQEDFPRSVTYLNVNTVLINANSGFLYLYCVPHLKWRVIGGDDTFMSYSCVAVSHDTQSIVIGNLYGSVVVILPTGELVRKDMCHCSSTFLTSTPSHISTVGKIYSVHWLTDTQILVSEHSGTLSLWKLQTNTSIPRLERLQMFHLPPCKHRWVTAACLLPGDLRMVCGDRSGSLYMYSLGKATDELLHPEQCFPKLHGKAGVTDVCYHGNYVYTTGRDGQYRQYTLTEDGILKLLNSNKLYKGFDWFEKLVFGTEFLLFGFHSVNFVLWNCSKSEKLLEIPCGGGHRSWSCLLRDNLVHFVYIKVQDIVVCRASMRPTLILKPPWTSDAGHQTYIVNVNTAFRHGRWVFEIFDVIRLHQRGDEVGGLPVLVQLRSQTLSMRIPTWEMGIRNFRRYTSSSAWRRSWWASRVSTTPQSNIVDEDSNTSSHMCLSCSEDTSLQLFHLNFKDSGTTTTTTTATTTTNTITTDVKILSTLQAHISSVRCLAVLPSMVSSSHPSATGSEAHLVISGGGRAQLNVWRLSLGSLSDGREKLVEHEETETEDREDDGASESNYFHEHLCSEFLIKRPRKLWKSRVLTLDPEMRILSLTAFHGHQIDSSVANGIVFVAAACSDGTIRLFCFDERQHNSNINNNRNRSSSSNQLHLVWLQRCHGGSCVLQVSHFLYYCSTQRHSNIGDTSCSSSGAGATAAGSVIVVLVSAATDGRLAFWDVTAICKEHIHQLLYPPPCDLAGPGLPAGFTGPSVNSNTSEHCLGSSSVYTVGEGSDPLDRRRPMMTGKASSVFCSGIDDDDAASSGGGGGGGGGGNGCGRGCGIDDGHCNSVDGNDDDNKNGPDDDDGDDGDDKNGDVDDDDDDAECLIYKMSAHQSGVNSLHLLQQEDSSFLLASGGDDNALFVMKFAISRIEDRTIVVCQSSVSYCSAHAAQITGVWLVNNTFLVSSSVDQRICVWQLQFGEKTAQVKYLTSQFVSIADISSMDVWQYRKRIFIAVCGTGMSLLTLDLPTSVT